MKEWVMIHKIKSLYDEGRGSSVRAIAKELGLARNTVRKYLRSDETEIAHKQDHPERQKSLDEYREYIVHLLQTYPQLTAVKVRRKLKEKYPALKASARTVRRYVEHLKQQIVCKQRRYYQPVLDMTPGVQCQVDAGELRSVLIGGIETTVYFVVFVLSYSRLMHVSVSREAINTQHLIEMHDAAFRYFGGCPEECVYDQTKLVVIEEEYRELILNQRFHQYATAAGFRICACEGYDPESKGKVEAGVKYVKHNALYGEVFSDWPALEAHLSQWLEQTANARCHGTTGQIPRTFYEAQERTLMKPYLTPSCLHASQWEGVVRKADKTGLISWSANKYSVPMRYQNAQVGVLEQAGELRIFDLENLEKIATHPLQYGRGQIVKNNHHYRDPEQDIARYEQQIETLLGFELGGRLCQRLKATSPKIYKDQLAAALALLKQHQPLHHPLLQQLSERPRLTARQMRDFLEAYQTHPQRLATQTVRPDAPSNKALQSYRGLPAANQDAAASGEARP